MCTATAKGLAHAAHKHLTAVEHNLARAACRVHSCTGQRHTRTHVPQLEGRTLPSEPASPAAVPRRRRVPGSPWHGDHVAQPRRSTLLLSRRRRGPGTPGNREHICLHESLPWTRPPRAPHTPRPGRKANSWFCLPRSPRCRRRVARSHGHAVGHGHAACLTPAHACTPNMAARPCLALAVVHCRTSALPNASRTRVNHSGCEPCPWPCSLPNRCLESPFTLPCSFSSLVVHRTPLR